MIGLCRFSYAGYGGFQVEHEDLAAREAFLFAPARMEERFRWFEHVCLPGWKAQTDPDFLFLILISPTLPTPYRDRLERLLSAFPQARIVERPPGRHRAVCREVINAHRTPDAPCLQVRHDDDDAVAVDFVARLRAAHADAAAFCAREQMVAFDFNRGFVLAAAQDGVALAPTVTPLWGVALGMYAGPRKFATILNFTHHQIHEHMPVLSQTDSPMYLRSHGGWNDSRWNRKLREPLLETPDTETKALIRDRFRVDLDQVARVFAAT